MRLPFAAALLAVMPLTADAATRDLTVSGFDRVSSGGVFDVVVTTGRQFSVRAEGDQSDLDRIEAVVEGGVLKIRKRERWSSGWSWSRDNRLRVYVTAPAIRGVSSSGAGSMKLDRGQGPRFEASVSGSGSLSVGEVQARDLLVKVSGSGNAELGQIGAEMAEMSVSGSGGVSARGRVRDLNAQLSGSAGLSLSGVEARTVHANLAGAGSLHVTARETAQVDASGAGRAVIEGGARCDVRKSGVAIVRCG